MKRFYRFTILFLFTSIFVKSAVITNSISGVWSSASTWSGGTVPGAGDDVVIKNGSTVTLDANFTCLSITIATGVNNSTLDLSGFTLNVTNTITINAPTVNNNVKRIVVGSGILNCGSVYMTDSGISSRDCFISISTGTVNVTGDITMPGAADRNYIFFNGSGILNITGGFISSGGLTLSGTSTVNYNASGSQSIKGFTYDNLTLSNSGVKTLLANTTILGNLEITGTAQLDVSATPKNLTIGGNWVVSSTNADPFIERTSSTTFLSSTTTQSIITALASGETFYNLTVNNTAASSPQLTLNKNLTISNDIDWVSGTMDIVGNNLQINGGTATSALSNGTILTTVPGSSITITDPSDTYTVNFNNFTVGTNTTSGAITLSLTSNSSNMEGLSILW